MRGDWFESHCVASQAVRQLEIVPCRIREVPANGGLIQIGAPSLDSQSLQLESGIGDSLRRMFEIFPFLGDCDRRPGSISTACPTRQSDSWPNSSTRKLVINVISRSLRPVMGLQLDKVVAPDTHFSGSSDEPSPFVNIEFHQTFVSHFQEGGLASFLIHHIGAFHDLVDFERLLAERAEDIFSIIEHALVHATEARTTATDAAPSCLRALRSRKPTNCTSFCGCNSFLPEPSVFCCDIGP